MPVANGTHLKIKPSPTPYREAHVDLLAHDFAAGDEGDRTAHGLDHAWSASEPGSFPERLADHLLERRPDACKRGSVCVEERAVERQQTLIRVTRFEDGPQARLFGLELRRALDNLNLQRFVKTKQPFFSLLSFGYVLEIYRQAAVACRIGSDVEPSAPRRGIVLEGDILPLRHGAAIVCFKSRTKTLRIFIPNGLADQFRARAAQHAPRRRIDVGEAPILVEGKE